MLCFVGIFSRLHSFRIVLHHCELFIFHSNVLLFLIRHLLAQAPLIFIIPFAISECHLYMSLAHSTLLITFHLNLIVSPSQIYISEFIFFIRVIHTIPYKINFIYFHWSNQRHKINNWSILIQCFMYQMRRFNENSI